MNDSERIDYIVRLLRTNYLTLAKSIGGNSDGRIRHIIIGRNGISKNTAMHLADAIEGLDYDWVLNGAGDPPKALRYRSEVGTQLPLPSSRAQLNPNGRLIGDYEPNEDMEPLVTKGGNVHRPVNNEMMLLEIPCVSEKARAGYLSGWEDPEYVETLPTILVPVKKVLKGKYRCFDAAGDSMTGGDTRYQIFDGEKVVGREVGHHLWKFKLHYNEFPNWVIHHEDGILIKQIIHHDVEGRKIILHSLNPDKSLYPDFEVSLNDVRELYNVVKRITEY